MRRSFDWREASQKLTDARVVRRGFERSCPHFSKWRKMTTELFSETWLENSNNETESLNFITLLKCFKKFNWNLLLTEMVRLSIAMGSVWLWRRRDAVRASRKHLAARHRPLQQVNICCLCYHMKSFRYQKGNRKVKIFLKLFKFAFKNNV